MKNILFLFTLICSFLVSCNSKTDKLDILIQKGELSKAIHIIEQKLQKQNDFSNDELKSMQKSLHDMKAVKEEYILSYNDVYEKLKSQIPNLSDADIKNWENDYSLEFYLIDGKKRYYYNCIFDLFQVNEEAAKRAKIIKDDSYDASPYPLETIKACRTNSSYPKNIKIAVRYFQDVSTMPNKSILKAWIPFVRKNHYQSEANIIHSNINSYSLPNNESLTSLIYFEHEINKSYNSNSAWEEYFTNPYQSWIKPMKKLPFVNDSTFIFQFIYSYKSEGVYRNIEAKDIKPYQNTDKYYNNYTKETIDNLFTQLLKDLSKDIIGTETNSYIKARLIYEWICKNITWTDPKPVLGDYAEYTAKYRRGDCSAKSNLFISLCRINNIPAKEQGGWTVFPNGKHAQHSWAQIYFQDYGWLPVDVTIGTHLINHKDKNLKYFYFGNCTPYHLIIYDDKPSFIPTKKYSCIYGGGAQLGAFEWEKEDLEPYIQFDSYVK